MKLLEKENADYIIDNIPFIDLQAQRKIIKNDIDTAINNVLNHGQFVMGPEVFELEEKLAEYCNSKFAISCSNGSDALMLSLLSLGVDSNCVVFLPSFSFISPPQMAALIGATPVFVDVLEDSFNMDPDSLEVAIKQIKSETSLKPKAVIAVDLFGQIADYSSISTICQKYGLSLIADAAQSFGSKSHNKQATHWADITTTSFFPAKPLGCYGEGGAIFTNDEDIAATLKSKRCHGMRNNKYNSEELGINGRLATMQAAILLQKLKIFDNEIIKRNSIAQYYHDNIKTEILPPNVNDDIVSTWAQYTLRCTNRDGFRDHLQQLNIPSAIYYPIPAHKQKAYIDYPVCKGGLPITQKLSNEVVSIPMHPYLERNTQDYIISSINSF